MKTRHATWLLALLAVATVFTFVSAAKAGESCGDGTCDAGEDSCNCVEDCGRTTCTPCDCGSTAGAIGTDCFCDADCITFGDCCDNVCDVCPTVCGTCGDGICAPNEDDDNCPSDCGCAAGACLTDAATPGGCFCDCACVGFNDCCSDAEAVCSVSTACCGDGTCGDGEDDENCPEDCGCAALGCIDDVATPGGCFCDCLCLGNNDCCSDAEAVCSLSTGCTGACCFPDGSCSDEAQGDCEAAGGTFQGDNTTCDLTLCPQPGACCFEADGSCLVLLEPDCLGLGGFYQGPGTVCDPNPCPQPGACCFEADGSCQVLSEGFCALDGGSFQGPGTACDPNPCPQPGACCFEADGSCQVLSEGFCALDGGSFQGPGTACDPNPCPQPGACCFEADGSCQVLSEGFCALDGGSFQGPGTACDPNPCPQPGACCFEADGSCQVLSEGFCALDGGSFQGPGTACDPNPCPQTGACCYDAKGTEVCQVITQSLCESGLSGTYFGDGTSCDSVSCDVPTGACCLAGDAAASSNVAGPVPADCVEVTAASCARVAGQYLGDGTSCDMDSCVTGACCFVDFDIPFPVAGIFDIECAEVPAEICPLLGDFPFGGGVYQGDGTTCAETNCEVGACCLGEAGLNVAGSPSGACLEVSFFECVELYLGEFQGEGTTCEESPCNPERVDISTKGSLLIFSDVELEFTQGPVAGPGGWNISKDTVISLTNDYPGEVYVQMYFINGDPEKEAIFSSGPLPVLISQQEPGCNWVDCAVLLTPDQSVYWSAASGNPVGCQPFGILDPDLGNGPGRPNPDLSVGPRVLRGYVVAWAVDAEGREINWNHLSGKATIVDYAAQAAWEYSPWAFQALFGVHGETLPGFGFIFLDGFEYASAFDMLLFDFFAAGSMALSSGGSVVSVDTDLTLHPVSHDLRQEHEPPITTKAHFDIWNMNERKLSNTRRCITCWDQVLLSQFNAPNNFLLMNLQSDKGKARIDGKQADECEENCFGDMRSTATEGNQTAGFLDDLLELDFVCSNDAALLGVAAKILRFGNNTIDYAGSELVGMGVEPAFILYDVVGPPGTLRDESYDRIHSGPSKSTRLDGGSNRGK